MNSTGLLKRIDELLAHAAQLNETIYVENTVKHVDWAANKGFRVAGLSFIERVYGADHPHYVEFDQTTNANYLSCVEGGVSILRAIQSEIAGGWLFTIKGLIAAELFADFLDMAEHFIECGYKDPAAVMIGGVLEEHLRQLASKNTLPTCDLVDDKQVPRKADRLNADLGHAGVYTKLDQKAITAWLDLRNKAAHGKYDEYNLEQVRNLLRNVSEFMARVQV